MHWIDKDSKAPEDPEIDDDVIRATLADFLSGDPTSTWNERNDVFDRPMRRTVDSATAEPNSTSTKALPDGHSTMRGH